MPDYRATQIDDMETFYRGLFRKARAEVGATAFGLAIVELEPGAENHPDHDHAGGQEEVFLVLRGFGTIAVDGEEVELTPETVVRVGPGVRRKITPGAEGMRLVAIGGVPGAAYDPPAYTELGAPDPLGQA